MTGQAKSWDILFSILSLTEVNYLIPVAEKLTRNGHKVCFVLFHDAAKKLLSEKNIAFYSMHSLKETVPYSKLGIDELSDFQSQYGIANTRDLYIREKVGYNRNNEHELLKKTIHYL